MIYRIFTIALILAIGAVTFVSAQSTERNLTRMSNDGANITWTVTAPSEGGTLTISTPRGEVVRQEFKPGNSPVFTSRDRLTGGDGQYRYEIVLFPIIPTDARAELAAARATGRSDEVYNDFVKRGIIPPRMVESGAFRVMDGLIYTADSGAEPGSSEKAIETGQPGEGNQTKTPVGTANGDIPPENVQVITQDLVVQGSQCIGVDCPSSPSFGFDTLRLQENNLRINFDDTSNSASFPSNDWEITANDTTNGGASYLAFTDRTAARQIFRVEAGAPANALVVESDGDIGLGTLNPVVELHMVDGNTPSFRLEQDGSSGFTAQVWDVAGNETNFFVRDVTGGSSLPFKIRPGAANNTLVVGNNSGADNVGIGTQNPDAAYKLDVVGDVRAKNFEIEIGTTGGITFADGTVQTTAGGGGGGGGETNTGANVGGGQGVFKQKVGAQLQFRSLTAGTGISVTASGADAIQIASTYSTLGPTYATTIFGGSGTILPGNTMTPTIEANTFGLLSNGAGFAVYNLTIPATVNLADPTGANVVFKIRYRDTDGAGTGTSVTVGWVTINIAAGNQTFNTIFSSNSNGGTGEQTVTVCQSASFFNFSTLGNHLNVTLFAGAGNSADLKYVQIYKVATCP